MPDLHIGVVSSDLGAGSYGLLSCEVPGGDGGRLQNRPRRPGCVPPGDPWISYTEGATHVPGGDEDPVKRVHESFVCIGEIGLGGGCGFEHHLEAARRALDPKLNVNPGFLRRDSLLAVSIITDEDDCSTARPELFDPSQQGVNDPLGLLTSFRCTALGLQCDEPLRQVGVKHNCRPSGNWLVKVEDCVQFFKSARPPGRSLFFALPAPPEPIEVALEGQNLVQRPTCQSINGTAVPTPRIRAAADSLGAQALHNPDGQDCCKTAFRPAFRRLGELILDVHDDRSQRDQPPAAAQPGSDQMGDVHHAADRGDREERRQEHDGRRGIRSFVVAARRTRSSGGLQGGPHRHRRG